MRRLKKISDCIFFFLSDLHLQERLKMGNVKGESAEAFSVEDSSTADSQASVSSIDYFNYNETAPVSDSSQFEAFQNPTIEEQGTITTDEEGIREDNNNESNESEADEYGPRDTSLLASFEIHRAKTLALGHTMTNVIILYLQDPSCLRVFHYSPTWDIGREVEKVQSLVNLQGLGKIEVISYKHYNATLIIAFVERWHPETNSFHFKWGEITITLEDVWKLVGLRVGGNLTVVQGKWGATNVKTTTERTGEAALKIFREAPDNYKLEDLCPVVVNLDENDDERILADGGGVGVGGGVGGVVGGGVLYCENVKGQNEDLCRLEEKISNLKSEVNSLKSAKEVKDRARSELLEAIELKAVECESLKEAYDRL
ncbi:hypothetical protein GIB67_010026 [Kingdonia uniflora]|uniref:Aminotransferase-like plant mobile domain-containing protein n=1 Tax=Kingdonia uniflora TaxID=39325 RepID=A0A7J7KV67_9MAGN|nr:hypothetical protein GIB67_010026 [Kingdonia uniflora]